MDDILDEIDPSFQEQLKRMGELETEAFVSVLKTRAGRRFIYSIFKLCGLFSMSYTGETNSTNFNLGRQSVAVDLQNQIKSMNHDAFMLMEKEAKEDEDYARGITE